MKVHLPDHTLSIEQNIVITTVQQATFILNHLLSPFLKLTIKKSI
ncbi:hypothetical protein [Zobellia uliginosa]|nr:hypothetical protein [Zobellia uliginosa]